MPAEGDWMSKDVPAPSDPPDLPASGGLVLFVCPHGAGKSRIAQAYFDAVTTDGWHSVSAGTQPQATVSAHAGRLLADTPAATLDTAIPRPVHAVPDPDVVVAIDCTDPPLPGAVAWSLQHQEFDTAMRDELRGLVAGLVRELGAAAPHTDTPEDDRNDHPAGDRPGGR
jgi:hypothetical protein